MRTPGMTAAAAGKSSDRADDRLEQAALLLEDMAHELRKMKSGEHQEAPEVPVSSEADLQVGHHVRVVRRDQYCGRTGVVMHRHGRLFWDVRLDAKIRFGEAGFMEKCSWGNPLSFILCCPVYWSTKPLSMAVHGPVHHSSIWVFPF
jgi:hypothetical protein